MADGAKDKRPAGWYSAEAKAERAESWRARRGAAADRRAAAEAERAAQQAKAEQAASPYRRFAQARLAETRPRPKPALPALSNKAKRRAKKVKPLVAVAEARRTRARIEWEQRHPKLAAEEATLARAVEARAKRWDHKAHGTAATHEEHAEAEKRHNRGALARLYQSGAIDEDQLADAEEIAMVAYRIAGDVTVRTASLETRINASRSNDGALIEGLHAVRMEIAYTEWRSLIPAPKQAVLDMIVGEPVGFTVVAKRYRIHNRKARRLLIEALDLWPGCRARARKQLNAAELAAFQAGLS